MSYTRLAVGLILISDLAMKNRENEVKMEIDFDYVAVCSTILLVVGLGIEIWKTVKDRNLSNEQQQSIKENQQLKSELYPEKVSALHRRVRWMNQVGHFVRHNKPEAATKR